MIPEILVAEDYEADAHLLQLLLRKNRVRNKAHFVMDGKAALDFIFARGEYTHRASQPLPGVVIIDIRLPKVDGWEVLRQLRHDPRTRDLPVIVMSGSVFDNEAKMASELGATACLSKPLRMDAMLDVFTRCGFKCIIEEPQGV